TPRVAHGGDLHVHRFDVKHRHRRVAGDYLETGRAGHAFEVGVESHAELLVAERIPALAPGMRLARRHGSPREVLAAGSVATRNPERARRHGGRWFVDVLPTRASGHYDATGRCQHDPPSARHPCAALCTRPAPVLPSA